MVKMVENKLDKDEAPWDPEDSFHWAYYNTGIDIIEDEGPYEEDEEMNEWYKYAMKITPINKRTFVLNPIASALKEEKRFDSFLKEHSEDIIQVVEEKRRKAKRIKKIYRKVGTDII